MLDNMVNGQVDKAHVKGPVARHQCMPEMINGGIFLMIGNIIEVFIIEKGIGLIHSFIFLPEAAFIEPCKKAWIHLAYFRSE